MRFRLRWPLVRRRTFDALLAYLERYAAERSCRIATLEAEIARLKNRPDVAMTGLRNVVDEVRSARDTLDRILSWKASE